MSINTSMEIKGRNKEVNHEEDRLSNLPNEILIKILSCLKTMEAIRSGILSTRWKSVWTSVPVLNLDQSDFKFKGKRSDGDDEREMARFLNFVDQVLIACKMPCLEKIRIHGKKCDNYLLRSWMRAALERNANELDVYFEATSAGFRCELTHSLFSHNKLVILKLRVNMTLNFLANSSAFPNLKVLQLDSFIYRDEDSLPNLLSSCPILEDLVIIRYEHDNLGTLNLISRSVKRIDVNHDLVAYLREGFVHKMVFDAPAVESLDIDCLITEEFLVKDLSRIVDARFNVSALQSFRDIYKLLQDISHVKYLRLGDYTVEIIVRSDRYDFPMFYNLIRLEICGNGRYESYDHTLVKPAKSLIWESMLEILKYTPMLEHVIYGADAEPAEECDEASDWDVPSCVASSLKTVEFNLFSESDGERVRYFLLNARELEKITIRYRLFSKDLKSELCDAIFENDKGSFTVTWSEKEVILSFR